jgi:transposase
MGTGGMTTISLDLRKRILAVCDEGEQTYQQIADRFKVSRAFVAKLVGQRKRTGSIESMDHRAGRKRLFRGELEERLIKLVRKQPDATLEELREQLDLDCHLSTIHRALTRIGERYKKKGPRG